MTAPAATVRFDCHCASHRGGRDNNEDAAEVVDGTPGFALSVVADGVGGEAWGEIASQTATAAAAGFIRDAMLASSFRQAPADVPRIVRLAFSVAVRSLRKRAAAERRLGGMRTTLVIAIAEATQVTYGYIGDGGLWLYDRDTDGITPLLHPMRTDAEGFLTASLGPRIYGSPYVGQYPAMGSSVVISATDGLADLIDAPQWTEVARAVAADERPDATLRRLLDHCASLTMDGRAAFTDNLTIAAIRKAA